MNKLKLFLSTISILLSILLSAESLALAYGSKYVPRYNLSDQPTRSQAIPKSLIDIRVPVQNVVLKEVHEGSNGKLLVHIQDAHSNYSGQMNLAKTIEFFIQQYGINLILSEGSSGDVTLDKLKPLGSKKDWEITAKTLLQEGIIVGEEYLNLVKDYPVQITGVENISLYFDGLKTYRNLIQKRKSALDYLYQTRISLEKLKVRFYPKELLNYESKKRNSSTQNLDLLHNLKPDHIYPSIQEYFFIKHMEQEIDYEKLNSERDEILMMLPLDARSKFLQVKQSQNPLSQYVWVNELLVLLQKAGELPRQYKHLYSYKSYLESFSKFDMEQLLSDAKSLEDDAYADLLLHEDQRRLRVLDKYLSLLEKAYRTQMTANEFNALVLNEIDFSTKNYQAFLNQKMLDLSLFEELIPYKKTLEEISQDIHRFYSIVSERDKVFVENTNKTLSEQGVDKAILITGGYHTSNLTDLLRREGYSYVVLSPFVHHTTDHKKYEQLLFMSLHQKNETAQLTQIPSHIQAIDTFKQPHLGTPSGASRLANSLLELRIPVHSILHRLTGAKSGSESIPERKVRKKNRRAMKEANELLRASRSKLKKIRSIIRQGKNHLSFEEAFNRFRESYEYTRAADQIARALHYPTLNRELTRKISDIILERRNLVRRYLNLLVHIESRRGGPSRDLRQSSIRQVIDMPLQKAIRILFKKGIRTTYSSADQNNLLEDQRSHLRFFNPAYEISVDDISKAAKGKYAEIDINYDALSRENRALANQLLSGEKVYRDVVLVRIPKQISNIMSRVNHPSILKVLIPINFGSSWQEVRSKSVGVAKLFSDQSQRSDQMMNDRLSPSRLSSDDAISGSRVTNAFNASAETYYQNHKTFFDNAPHFNDTNVDRSTRITQFLDWYRKNQAQLVSKEDSQNTIGASYVAQVLVHARKVSPDEIQAFRFEAAAHDYAQGSSIIQNAPHFNDPDVDTSTRITQFLDWYRKNQPQLVSKEDSQNTLGAGYVAQVLVHAGKVNPNDLVGFLRSAAAHDYAQGSSIIQNAPHFNDTNVDRSTRITQFLDWYRKNQAQLVSKADNQKTLGASYAASVLAHDGKITSNELQSFNFEAAAYEYAQGSNSIQNAPHFNDPDVDRSTRITQFLDWYRKNQAQLVSKADSQKTLGVSYVALVLVHAGKITSDELRSFQIEAGAFFRAINDRGTIEQEIQRIWSSKNGAKAHRSPLARLKSEFNPLLLPNTRVRSYTKPLSKRFRDKILTYAFKSYGESLIQTLSPSRLSKDSMEKIGIQSDAKNTNGVVTGDDGSRMAISIQYHENLDPEPYGEDSSIFDEENPFGSYAITVGGDIILEEEIYALKPIEVYKGLREALHFVVNNDAFEIDDYEKVTSLDDRRGAILVRQIHWMLTCLKHEKEIIPLEKDDIQWFVDYTYNTDEIHPERGRVSEVLFRRLAKLDTERVYEVLLQRRLSLEKARHQLDSDPKLRIIFLEETPTAHQLRNEFDQPEDIPERSIIVDSQGRSFLMKGLTHGWAGNPLYEVYDPQIFVHTHPSNVPFSAVDLILFKSLWKLNEVYDIPNLDGLRHVVRIDKGLFIFEQNEKSDYPKGTATRDRKVMIEVEVEVIRQDGERIVKEFDYYQNSLLSPVGQFIHESVEKGARRINIRFKNGDVIHYIAHDEISPDQDLVQIVGEFGSRTANKSKSGHLDKALGARFSLDRVEEIVTDKAFVSELIQAGIDRDFMMYIYDVFKRNRHYKFVEENIDDDVLGQEIRITYHGRRGRKEKIGIEFMNEEGVHGLGVKSYPVRIYVSLDWSSNAEPLPLRDIVNSSNLAHMIYANLSKYDEVRHYILKQRKGTPLRDIDIPEYVLGSSSYDGPGDLIMLEPVSKFFNPDKMTLTFDVWHLLYQPTRISATIAKNYSTATITIPVKKSINADESDLMFDPERMDELDFNFRNDFTDEKLQQYIENFVVNHFSLYPIAKREKHENVAPPEVLKVLPHGGMGKEDILELRINRTRRDLERVVSSLNSANWDSQLLDVDLMYDLILYNLGKQGIVYVGIDNHRIARMVGFLPRNGHSPKVGRNVAKTLIEFYGKPWTIAQYAEWSGSRMANPEKIKKERLNHALRDLTEALQMIVNPRAQSIIHDSSHTDGLLQTDLFKPNEDTYPDLSEASIEVLNRLRRLYIRLSRMNDNIKLKGYITPNARRVLKRDMREVLALINQNYDTTDWATLFVYQEELEGNQGLVVTRQRRSLFHDLFVRAYHHYAIYLVLEGDEAVWDHLMGDMRKIEGRYQQMKAVLSKIKAPMALPQEPVSVEPLIPDDEYYGGPRGLGRFDITPDDHKPFKIGSTVYIWDESFETRWENIGNLILKRLENIFRAYQENPLHDPGEEIKLIHLINQMIGWLDRESLYLKIVSSDHRDYSPEEYQSIRRAIDFIEEDMKAALSTIKEFLSSMWGIRSRRTALSVVHYEADRSEGDDPLKVKPRFRVNNVDLLDESDEEGEQASRLSKFSLDSELPRLNVSNGGARLSVKKQNDERVWKLSANSTAKELRIIGEALGKYHAKGIRVNNLVVESERPRYSPDNLISNSILIREGAGSEPEVEFVNTNDLQREQPFGAVREEYHNFHTSIWSDLYFLPGDAEVDENFISLLRTAFEEGYSLGWGISIEDLNNASTFNLNKDDIKFADGDGLQEEVLNVELLPSEQFRLQSGLWVPSSGVLQAGMEIYAYMGLKGSDPRAWRYVGPLEIEEVGSYASELSGSSGKFLEISGIIPNPRDVVALEGNVYQLTLVAVPKGNMVSEPIIQFNPEEEYRLLRPLFVYASDQIALVEIDLTSFNQEESWPILPKPKKVDDLHEVSFRFVPHKNIDVGNLKEVHLVGSFNEWSPGEKSLMTQHGKFNFWDSTILLSQGIYEYKFLLIMKDGSTEWISYKNDPYNPNQILTNPEKNYWISVASSTLGRPITSALAIQNLGEITLQESLVESLLQYSNQSNIEDDALIEIIDLLLSFRYYKEASEVVENLYSDKLRAVMFSKVSLVALVSEDEGYAKQVIERASSHAKKIERRFGIDRMEALAEVGFARYQLGLPDARGWIDEAVLTAKRHNVDTEFYVKEQKLSLVARAMALIDQDSPGLLDEAVLIVDRFYNPETKANGLIAIAEVIYERDRNKAIELLEQAKQINRDNTITYRDKDFGIWLRISELESKMGMDSTNSSLEEAITEITLKNRVSLPTTRAKRYATIAQTYLSRNDLDNALKFLNKSEEASIELAERSHNQLQTYLSKDKENDRTNIRYAANEYKNMIVAYLRIAGLAHLLGSKEQSETFLKKAQEEFRNMSGLFGLGHDYLVSSYQTQIHILFVQMIKLFHQHQDRLLSVGDEFPEWLQLPIIPNRTQNDIDLLDEPNEEGEQASRLARVSVIDEESRTQLVQYEGLKYLLSQFFQVSQYGITDKALGIPILPSYVAETINGLDAIEVIVSHEDEENVSAQIDLGEKFMTIRIAASELDQYLFNNPSGIIESLYPLMMLAVIESNTSLLINQSEVKREVRSSLSNLTDRELERLLFIENLFGDASKIFGDAQISEDEIVELIQQTIRDKSYLPYLLYKIRGLTAPEEVMMSIVKNIYEEGIERYLPDPNSRLQDEVFKIIILIINTIDSLNEHVLQQHKNPILIRLINDYQHHLDKLFFNLIEPMLRDGYSLDTYRDDEEYYHVLKKEVKRGIDEYVHEVKFNVRIKEYNGNRPVALTIGLKKKRVKSQKLDSEYERLTRFFEYDAHLEYISHHLQEGQLVKKEALKKSVHDMHGHELRDLQYQDHRLILTLSEPLYRVYSDYKKVEGMINNGFEIIRVVWGATLQLAELYKNAPKNQKFGSRFAQIQIGPDDISAKSRKGLDDLMFIFKSFFGQKGIPGPIREKIKSPGLIKQIVENISLITINNRSESSGNFIIRTFYNEVTHSLSIDIHTRDINRINWSDLDNSNILFSSMLDAIMNPGELQELDVNNPRGDTAIFNDYANQIAASTIGYMMAVEEGLMGRYELLSALHDVYHGGEDRAMLGNRMMNYPHLPLLIRRTYLEIIKASHENGGEVMKRLFRGSSIRLTNIPPILADELLKLLEELTKANQNSILKPWMQELGMISQLQALANSRKMGARMAKPPISKTRVNELRADIRDERIRRRELVENLIKERASLPKRGLNPNKELGRTITYSQLRDEVEKFMPDTRIEESHIRGDVTYLKKEGRLIVHDLKWIISKSELVQERHAIILEILDDRKENEAVAIPNSVLLDQLHKFGFEDLTIESLQQRHLKGLIHPKLLSQKKHKELVIRYIKSFLDAQEEPTFFHEIFPGVNHLLVTDGYDAVVKETMYSYMEDVVHDNYAIRREVTTIRKQRIKSIILEEQSKGGNLSIPQVIQRYEALHQEALTNSEVRNYLGDIHGIQPLLSGRTTRWQNDPNGGSRLSFHDRYGLTTSFNQFSFEVMSLVKGGRVQQYMVEQSPLIKSGDIRELRAALMPGARLTNKPKLGQSIANTLNDQFNNAKQKYHFNFVLSPTLQQRITDDKLKELQDYFDGIQNIHVVFNQTSLLNNDSNDVKGYSTILIADPSEIDSIKKSSYANRNDISVVFIERGASSSLSMINLAYLKVKYLKSSDIDISEPISQLEGKLYRNNTPRIRSIRHTYDGKAGSLEALSKNPARAFTSAMDIEKALLSRHEASIKA